MDFFLLLSSLFLGALIYLFITRGNKTPLKTTAKNVTQSASVKQAEPVVDTKAEDRKREQEEKRKAEQAQKELEESQKKEKEQARLKEEAEKERVALEEKKKQEEKQQEERQRKEEQKRKEEEQEQKKRDEEKRQKEEEEAKKQREQEEEQKRQQELKKQQEAEELKKQQEAEEVKKQEAESQQEETKQETQSETEKPKQEETSADSELFPVFLASHSFKARTPRELSFDANDEIVVVAKSDAWWRGRNLTTNHFGWFPSNYVKETGREMASIVIPESSDELAVDEDDEETRNIKLAQKVDPGIAALREQLAKTQQGVFKEEENTTENN